MFPIVPNHLMVASAAVARRQTSHNSGSLAASTSTPNTSHVSGRNHSIWNMWNTALIDNYKTTKSSSKRSASIEITQVGCVAACSLPNNSHAEPGQILPSVIMTAFDRPHQSQPLRIGLSSRSQLCLETDTVNGTTNPSNWSWINQILVADDVHSNNIVAEIHRHEDGRKELRVRTVRYIDAGDSLRLWFNEEVAALMGVPFLAPANIRGKNTYTCQSCDESFENPNPLKIHIATSCDRRSQFELWLRVEQSINRDNLAFAAATSPLPTPISTARTSESLTGATINSSLPNHLSAWLTHHPYHQIQQQRHMLFHQHQPHQHQIHMQMTTDQAPINHEQTTNSLRLSAFQPVSTKMPNCSPSRISPTSTHFLNPFSYPPIAAQFHPASAPHRHHLHPVHRPSHTDSDSANSAAAHLETIVSNMGTNATAAAKASTSASAGGHLCIYCGKVYSRKYGLKIHIRTHTGFKPLKCKYCFRPFGDPSNLNKHVRLHVQGSTIYKCPEPQCDKILVRRRDLQRHLQTRHAAMDDGEDDGHHHGRDVESEDNDEDEGVEVQVDVEQTDEVRRDDHLAHNRRKRHHQCRRSSSPLSESSSVYAVDHEEVEGTSSSSTMDKHRSKTQRRS